MIKTTLTVVGIGLSLIGVSSIIYILIFENEAFDHRQLVAGSCLAGALFFDLFYRIRIVVSRLFYSKRNWARQARRYGGYSTLLLIFPLIWMTNTKHHVVVNELNTPLYFVASTLCYNLFISFF